MIEYISIVCISTMCTMELLYLILGKLIIHKMEVIRGRKMNLQLLTICTILVNVIALIASINLESEYYIMHIPLILGCLLSLVPSVMVKVYRRKSNRIFRYSLLKIFVMVFLLINMLLAYLYIECAPYILLALSILFILPDLNILLNLHKVRKRL